MSYTPCSPCYTNSIFLPKKCGISPTAKTHTDLVNYAGPNLPCTGILSCDTLTVALQKIDAVLCGLLTTTTTSTTSTTTTII